MTEPSSHELESVIIIIIIIVVVVIIYYYYYYYYTLMRGIPGSGQLTPQRDTS